MLFTPTVASFLSLTEKRKMNTKSINPYSLKVIATYPIHKQREIKALIQKGDSVFAEWRDTSLKSRSKLLSRAGKIMLQEKKELASLITAEMGKPINQSLSEIETVSYTHLTLPTIYSV